MCEVKLDSSKMLMDCHAVQAPLAMTEKGQVSKHAAGFFYTTAKDSKISKETSAIAERYPLFCDEKAGLRRLLCGDKTRCLSHKQKASSPALSRKAESTSEKLTREKTKNA